MVSVLSFAHLPLLAVTCTPECVNGDCTDRDQCTCNSGWTGEACDKEQQGKLGIHSSLYLSMFHP